MTRAEAIERLNCLNNKCDPYECIDVKCYKCDEAVEMAIKALEQDRPKWIPCSERLPEEGLTVLICAEGGEIEFGQLTEYGWEWLAESMSDYWTEAEEVIAWQPLPEPYEEAEQ